MSKDILISDISITRKRSKLIVFNFICLLETDFDPKDPGEFFRSQFFGKRLINVATLSIIYECYLAIRTSLVEQKQYYNKFIDLAMELVINIINSKKVGF